MTPSLLFCVLPFIGEPLRQFSVSGFGVVSASAQTVDDNASHKTSLIPNGRNEALRCATVPRCACASPATGRLQCLERVTSCIGSNSFLVFPTFTVGGTMFDMNQCLQG